MLENIQGRLYAYFNLEDENAGNYNYIIEVSEKIIELYPAVVYPYNNIAAVYYSQGDYEGQ